MNNKSNPTLEQLDLEINMIRNQNQLLDWLIKTVKDNNDQLRADIAALDAKAK